MVVASELMRPLTLEDLAAFPDDGMRREIVTGELVATPAPSPAHQIVLARLFKLLVNFVDEHDSGFVLTAPIDVRLSPNDVVEPDLVFIAKDRASIINQRYIDGAPDLVVEVLSPSTRQMDLVRKRALYARSGIAEYWITDLDRQTLVLHRMVDGQYVENDVEDGAHQSAVLDGFSVVAAALFRSMPGVS